MRRVLTVITALACLPVTASGQDSLGVVTTTPRAYEVRPGDVLLIRVWGQEDFTGQFQVDVNGQIQYPVLGDIDTRNLTVGDIRDRIREGLGALFRTSFVTVTPLFRMAVLGEVRQAGLYTVDPTLSVIDVVALAGGPSPDGNMRRIRLFRGGDRIELDFEAESLSGRTLAEIGVRSGDEIVVPRKPFTRNDVLMLLSLIQVALSAIILVYTL